MMPHSRGHWDTGSILGTVLDSSGGLISGANVVVQNQGTGASWKLTAGASGNFVAPVLAVGTYRVTASAAGFKSKTLEDLALRVSDRLRLEIVLEPGAITEKVTVTGEAPLVEASSTTLGGLVARHQINELPLNGRNLTQLLAVIPGAMLLGGSTQQSINGASTFRSEGGVRFLLDGADASRVDFDILDNTYGSSKGRITRASVDSVQEFRVYASSFSAEFGQGMGGVVNLITKSGTNRLHGNVFEYFRNEKLDTRNYFNTGAKPPFRLNQFGGSLGGPIRKDKLFFFGNYEGVRQRQGVTQNTFVPTEEFRRTVAPALKPVLDMLPLPNAEISTAEPRLGRYLRNVSNPLTENTASVKIDYRVSDRDNVSGRYNVNDSLTKTFFGVARGQAQSAPGLLQLVKLTYTRVFSPRMLNEAGFAVNRVHIDPRAAETEEILNFPIVGLGSGSAGVGPGLFDLQVANNSFTFLDTVSWVQGSHQWKFGAQIIRNQDNKALNFQRSVTYQNLGDFAINSPFSVGTLGQPRRGMRNTYDNFFVQDDIQASRVLTINAGLRYQYDTSPSEASGVIANFDPLAGRLDPRGTRLLDAPKANFAPRLGIAWSPLGANKTVIRTGFGLFHGTLNAAIAQNVPNNVLQQSATITRQEVPGLVGFPFPQIGSFAAVANFTGLPKDWKTASTAQWNFVVQQPLGSQNLVQIAYIGNRGTHLLGGRNLNRLIAGTSRRPYPSFGNITFTRVDLISSYHSFQASFRRRFAHGLAVNLNYTWAHTLDQGGIAFGTAAQDDTNPRDAYGNADFDARHALEFDYTYQLPAPPALPGWLGKGWQVNGITVMRTGLSVNVVCGCDSMLIGVTSSRADVVPGVSPRPASVDIPNNQINLAAFRRPATGTFGNLGRNTLKGPPAFNWDFSVFKNFQAREGHSVQFRAEMFNTFNTPQFGLPGSNLSAPVSFGRSLGTLSALGGFGTNRQVQFALRYSF
ncbi:MAG: TonB-dependent receptor [Acidobacteria bacterium]|nr:TonB-dependent receptor [Acidobacteriota bacterium]